MSAIPIKKLIGKSIQGGYYLSITYENKKGETNPFWISVVDILNDNEILVNMYNLTKEDPIFNGKIFIAKIKTAEILNFSYYTVPNKLLDRIIDSEVLQPFNPDEFNSGLLQYYLECYKANADPFLHQKHLISGIDVKLLLDTSPFNLSVDQQNQVIKEIYNNNYSKYNNYELAISELSIEFESKGTFIICFRKLKFDPVEKTLVIGESLCFNPNFYIKNTKHNLSYYMDMSPADFEIEYKNNKLELIDHLSNLFKRGEIVNTRPEIVVLGYSKIDITPIFENINKAYQEKQLSTPLKALFQSMTTKDYKTQRKPNLVLYDNNLNIDQIRSIHNILKYPVTYIQGPPGTGKTQTIFNIIVNSIIAGKSVLITSNNNIPVDGILEKLSLEDYRNKPIMPPVIRLGNTDYTLKALDRIRELFEFNTKDIPKEELLLKLKEKSKIKNKILDDRLDAIDINIDLKQYLEFIDGLLEKNNYELLIKEKEKISRKISDTDATIDDDLTGSFEIIKGNHEMLQFFYFESLKYIKRIKLEEYRNLVEIVYLKDDNERIKEFNKWLSSDANMKSFSKLFPIVLTTNLSSRRLGTNYKFDLLVIDEAGQCDIPSSLIPISKCNNLALIGDTNQLKPIIILDEDINKKLMSQFEVSENYNYLSNSILSAFQGNDNISRRILLRFHYRCGKKIVSFSNDRYYGGKLDLTKINSLGEVSLIKVNNFNQKHKNSQIEEAKTIIEYIKSNNLDDVFILTPFRNQEEVLNHYIDDAKKKKEINENVKCGTIHKVQGQESNTVIISTAISKSTSQRSYDWIKNNSELINVGITRAKEKLIVVADQSAIDILSRKDDDLYSLLEYVEQNGTTKITESNANKLSIGFSNNSEFENQFYITMQQYCSLSSTRFVRNVKVLDLFPDQLYNDNLNKKEFDGIIYEGNVPKMVFEVDGAEHYNKKKRIDADTKKMELLARKGIKLFKIPNHYVKHYEFIRELINKLNNKAYQTDMFSNYENN